MKQFNKWLLALVVLLLSAGAHAQCGSAIGILENSTQSVSLPGATDSAWYSFTVPTNGYITITSCDRNAPEMDTRLYLYDGACGTLNALGTSDNDCGLAALLNDVAVQSGKTYFLVWDNKTAGALSFDFTVSFVANVDYVKPVNDNICSAIELTDGVTIPGNNEDATVQGINEFNLTPNATGWLDDKNVHNTVWYSFVAPSTGVVDLSVTANFDVQLALFSGDCSDITGMTLMSSADQGMTQNDASFRSYCVEEGTTYYVMVDGFGTESGDFDLVYNVANINMPFAASAFNTENLVNGVLCPGANNFNLFGKMIATSDMSDVAEANYVNTLGFIWTNAEGDTIGTNDTLLNQTAGTYTVAITDVCNRTFTDEITLTDVEVATFDLILGATTNPTCVDGYTGTAVLTHNGGLNFADGSYDDTQGIKLTIKHSLNPAATEADLDALNAGSVMDMTLFDGLEKGTYRIYAEDACGNIDSVTFSLVNPEVNQVVLTLNEASDPFCPGTATGVIDVTAVGGEGEALEFSWYYFDGMTYNLTSNIDTDFTGLEAGQFRVIAIDPCLASNTDTLDVTLTDPTIAALEFTAVKVNPTSFAANNGSIDITVTGGKPSYNATWWVDGNVWDSYNDMLSLTNLHQGIYRVYITDTCSMAGVIDTTFVVLAPVANDTACGAILISTEDSLTTYHNQGATVNGESGLVMPANQDDGYTGWTDVNFNQGVWFKFVAPESGAVEVAVNHYQGLVSNLNFDPQVAIYDAETCSSTKTLLSANDNNLNGPAVNDSYLETFCLTPGNTYYLLVDGYQGIGVQGIFSIDLNEIELNDITVNTDVNQPTCLDEKGSVYFDNIEGGVYREDPEVYTYTYTFTGPNNNKSGSIKVDFDGDIYEVSGLDSSYFYFTGLDAGTYYLTVKDTCGHASIDTIEISPNTLTPFNLEGLTLTQPDCPGDNNGMIEFILTGGGTPGQYYYEIYKNAPFLDYVADGSANSITPTQVSGVDAGLYFVEVWDLCDNANTKEYVIELTDRELSDFAVTSSSVDPTCPSAEGSAHVVLTGGRLIANYELRTGVDYATGTYVTDDSFNDSIDFALVAGNYWLRVEDHCTGDADTLNIVITDPTAPVLAVETEQSNPSVFEGTDGTYTYTVTGGFYDYTASLFVLDAPLGAVIDTIFLNENREDSTAYNVTGLSAGTYRLVVADRCEFYGSSQEFTLLNPPANDNICSATTLTVGTPSNGNNAAATVQPGEILGLNLNLDEDCESTEGWCSNDGIDGSVWYKFSVPASGAFAVTVSSNDFDAQVAVFTSDNCQDFNAFTTLALNDNQEGNAPTSQVRLGCLTPGTTIYVLVDSRDGITGDFTVTAEETNTLAFSVTGTSTDASTEISKDGMIELSPDGGVKPYSYAWSNGLDSLNTMSGLDTGSYSVIVSDKCGSSDTLSFTIDYTKLSNDDRCDAKLLSIDGEKTTFFNYKATYEAGEEVLTPDTTQHNCFSDTAWCTDGITASLWFKFVAPQSGNVRVDLCSAADNAFDPQLAVYQAELCVDLNGFTMVGANDDSPTCSFGSGLNLSGLTPCETYYILVDADEDARGTSAITLFDLGSTLNAGRDTTITRCNTAGDIDLNSLIGLGADMDGKFSDDDASGELSGAVFAAGEVEPGTYHFTYTVADSCDVIETTADRAVITVIVTNCTGVEENKAGQLFAVYPNPNNGQFTIESAVADAMSVEVRDVTGKVVFNGNYTTVAGTKIAVNLNAQAKGMYTVRVNGEVAGTEVRRVIVH